MSPILKSLKISFFDILTIHKLDFDLQSLEADKRTNALTDKKTDALTDKKTDALTDKKTDALTDKKTDTQTENWKKLT